MPKDFNPGSSKQLGELLYKKLKLPVLNETANGTPSTDADTLEELIENKKGAVKAKRFLEPLLLSRNCPMFSPEVHARLDQLRAIAQQRKLTQEEEAEAVKLIRGERKIAATVSAASKACWGKTRRARRRRALPRRQCSESSKGSSPP